MEDSRKKYVWMELKNQQKREIKLEWKETEWANELF